MGEELAADISRTSVNTIKVRRESHGPTDFIILTQVPTKILTTEH